MAGKAGHHILFILPRWLWTNNRFPNHRLSHHRLDTMSDIILRRPQRRAFINQEFRHLSIYARHTQVCFRADSIPEASRPPSYLVNHQEYYYSQAPSLSSNPSSLAVSPQSQHIMTPGTVYSSPDTAPAGSDPEQQVRVISFRPKPQCWDHGCNGREFSTFSNLLRHQREKSGVVAKAECPSCGAVFTRTTARNIHVSQGKCKGGGRETSSE
ncbi:hypothetical protein BDV33DRAFT_190997 [Aspergillus novoparasiticus]|uniref:C2H2-type domain-containing protein n=1 Tax=Aspergillus novoparasiticus TaxID=986946 RepID=A0A5N6EVA2_9EURO|nr:hypothetical protein BDV33DRAFT_190997 [Aspergillus novoparasiticus]